MRHGSLFNGIGGFQLAAHWMGWENIFHCEIDPFCNRVVKKHFPESICYEDIKKTDFSQWHGAIDILTGGFPWQPYSTAGKRLGKDDERHLWPEMLRAIREIQPRWVVGENVRGLTNWNGGMVFDEVQADLEAEGYKVLPFLLPAAGIQAPHERQRIWFIAHSERLSWDGRLSHQTGRSVDNRENIEWKEAANKFERFCAEKPVANATSKRSGETGNDITGSQERSAGHGSERIVTYSSGQRLPIRLCGELGSVPEAVESSARGEFTRVHPKTSWDQFPTQSPICGGDDEFPDWVDQLKSLGNAVVPALVLQIFKAIESYENL